MEYLKLASYFDHTALKPTVTKAELADLANEANTYGFQSVCVNLSNVPIIRPMLSGTVKTCTVIDFPFGSSTPTAKLFQVKEAYRVGANEVDVVINIGKLLEGDKEYCIDELSPIAVFTHEHAMVMKVIVETGYLDEEGIKRACNIVEKSRADFIKTSTGFGSRGASFDDIILFKKYLKGKTKIKAAGGIKTLAEVKKYLALGCDRIGCSNSVAIMNEAYAKNKIAQSCAKDEPN